jgi:hypothetical protein
MPLNISKCLLISLYTFFSRGLWRMLTCTFFLHGPAGRLPHPYFWSHVTQVAVCFRPFVFPSALKVSMDARHYGQIALHSFLTTVTLFLLSTVESATSSVSRQTWLGIKTHKCCPSSRCETCATEFCKKNLRGSTGHRNLQDVCWSDG